MPNAPHGLTAQEATERIARYGYNELPEAPRRLLRKFLTFFWGPIPWMIEVAFVLSVTLHHAGEAAIIAVLLFANAIVGFWQEYHADDAMRSLRDTLAPTVRVRRDDDWKVIPARELVPGDIILVRLGDVIPADATLFDCDPIEVDESMLTGESLPVTKQPGATIFAGAIVRKGEIEGVVTATGMQTRFGRTLALLRGAQSVNHLQREVLAIGNALLVAALVLAMALFFAALFRHESFTQALQFALILAVAAIPAAMPAVLTSTMALGARALAVHRAIVTTLESIHELAGMDTLCCDKTGTLTRNALAVERIVPLDGCPEDELLVMAKLASKRQIHDPIDSAILECCDVPGALKGYDVVRFVPFDPSIKRTEAFVRCGSRSFRVAKGSTAVIFDMCGAGENTVREANRCEEQFAASGMRTLAVARAEDGGNWTLLGLLALSDPPREDAATTVAEARAMGIAVKMITGDQLPIAREMSKRLGLGGGLLDAATFERTEQYRMGELDEQIERADAFAKAFPDHKYHIVEALQKHGHIVGMTGDGVNDAPALKKADVGIAVHHALDAARAAADIVLLAPGLSVIVEAIKESRRIFRRMTSYAIYRIAETIRVLLFITFSVLVFRFYPVTPVMVILLALLNDGAILSIAFDRADVGALPQRWNMRVILTVAFALGIVGVASSFLLFYLAERVFVLPQDVIQTLIYLKLSVAGHLMIFHTRTRGSIFESRPANILLGATLFTQALATFIAVSGVFITPIHWYLALLVWGYALVWIVPNEAAKRFAYRLAEGWMRAEPRG